MRWCNDAETRNSGNNDPYSYKKVNYGRSFYGYEYCSKLVRYSVPGGHLYINDIVICLAALLFTPKEAFFVGGIGAFLGDFFFYPAPMFVSLVTHGLQAGMIAVLIAGGEEKRSKGRVIGALLVGAVIMVIGYSLGRAYVYSTPEYSLIKLPFEILQAMIGVVFSYILYFYTSVREAWKKHISE